MLVAVIPLLLLLRRQRKKPTFIFVADEAMVVIHGRPEAPSADGLLLRFSNGGKNVIAILAQ